MAFIRGGESYATIIVDATKDKRNVWWALVERKVSQRMDLSLLQRPGYVLRLEARIRSSDAPRRINLQFLTQRTTDYHSHLVEYDLAEANRWYTISMTTSGFDAAPGDTVFAHLALMDWGLETYQLDLDYIKAEIVNTATSGPDQGDAVPYPAPTPPLASFTHHLPVAHDSTIDLQNPGVNLNDWQVEGKQTKLLSVDGAHYVILRWDLRAFAGRKAVTGGVLEVTTFSVQRKSEPVKDFGMVRVVEILGGDPTWDQATVTMDSLCRGMPLSRVFNPQMIVDRAVTPGDGGKTLIPISQPVLQRLLDGKTRGIALEPLGAISAAFYAMENEVGENTARLHFRLQER